MTLLRLIRKGPARNFATATVAIPATHAATVAKIATVAVANPREKKAEQTASLVHDLPSLLHLHGGYPSIDWTGLALIDTTTSALWIVQRPDGLLTVLTTVEPIPKPTSYTAAWPARFTSPEPLDDTAIAEQAAQTVIACARARHCDACTHWRGEKSHPVCLQGHRLAWRQIGPGGVRTAPSRADARPCPDQTPE